MGGFANVPAALATLTLFVSPMAHAVGSSESPDGQRIQSLSIEDAARFSKQIEDSLAANGARVAMVFRAGRDREELPEDIRYTHGAFWVYQTIQRSDGTEMNGYAVYNLYSGDGANLPRTQSSLVQDFPLDFVEGAAEDDVAVIIPSPELQRRILAIMANGSYDDLHVDAYSLVSNPGDPSYQNCNEFMLDVIAAAAWETTDYQQIKANLAEHFIPTVINANLFERLFAPLADSQIRTSDHGRQIETATYESLGNFLRTFEMLQSDYLIVRDADAGM